MSELYTPSGNAAEILGERQSNSGLVTRVMEYLSGDLPGDGLLAPPSKPIAMLANFVARATGEDLEFASAAREARLEPYWATFVSSAYTTTNPEKVSTVRPPLQLPKGQRTKRWIVDGGNRQGGVGQLQTIYGITVSEFHQNLRQLVFQQADIPDSLNNVFDMGEWYERQARRAGYSGEGKMVPYYVRARLALLTIFCAYFYDYSGVDRSYMSSVLLPAIEDIKSTLGLMPVIVKLEKPAHPSDTNLSFLSEEKAQRLQQNGNLK